MSFKTRNNHGQFVSKRTQLKWLFMTLVSVTAITGSFYLSQPVEAEMIVPQLPAREIKVPVRDISKVPRVIVAAPVSIEGRVRARFGVHGDTMLAIFKNESSLNPRAQGWNCYYDINGNYKSKKTEKTDKSKACKKEDRYRSWSVDCGIGQINSPGTVCPEKLFEIEHNLDQSQKKLSKEGLNAWVVYKTGTYRRYL